MKKFVPYYTALLLLCGGCTKTIDALVETGTAGTNETAPGSSQFVTFTIKKGEHYASGNDLKAVETGEMKFTVLFDSSAIYESATRENQYDINKLYGFSDNNSDHHSFSARFGWRWSDHALRLFAYVYNNGIVGSQELATVTIGTPTICSIKVTPTSYIFSVDGESRALPRESTTPVAKGYQLYPYFGGDEPAPHTITIRIK